MTAKKAGNNEGITEKGVLEADIRQLMTPLAIKELKDLSPTLQQFLLRWQDKRDMVLEDKLIVILSAKLKKELKAFLLDVYEKDNEALCKNVTNAVCKQLAEVMSPIWIKLEELSKGQKEIMTTLRAMEKRLDEIENRVYMVDDKKIKDLEIRISEVEKTIKKITVNKL